MNEFCIIFWTCRDAEEAKKICKQLLEKKWVACVSILPDITSMFYWDQEIQEEREVKVLIKTSSSRYLEIQDFIQKHASYEVPEVLQIPIEMGNPDYLKWIRAITT